MTPDIKARAIVGNTSAIHASCGLLTVAEPAEDGEAVEDDVEDVTPAVSVAAYTRYSIACAEKPTYFETSLSIVVVSVVTVPVPVIVGVKPVTVVPQMLRVAFTHSPPTLSPKNLLQYSEGTLEVCTTDVQSPYGSTVKALIPSLVSTDLQLTPWHKDAQA